MDKSCNSVGDKKELVATQHRYDLLILVSIVNFIIAVKSSLYASLQSSFLPENWDLLTTYSMPVVN